MSKKTISLVLIMILLSVIIAACGGGNNEDTQDPNIAITNAVETAMVALTQTAMFEPSPTFTFTPTFEPSPTFTATVVSQTNPTAVPTQSGSQSGVGLSSCDLAAFVEDITIPDGTEMMPGQTFTKVWRISNEGTCTWTSGYQILYYGGEIMSTETAYALTDTDIAPGESLDISIEMTAPSTEGSYTMWWIMRNADGENFGVDASGGAIYVQITVSSTAAGFTATPTATTEATEVPTEVPTDTPTPTYTETPDRGNP